MALSPWVHENKFEAGTVIRAESANVKFDGIASKLEEIIQQLNTRVVTLPEVFTGSPQIPEQTPENTYIYINGDGDIALYSIQEFVDDVASTATNAAQAKAFRDAAGANAALAQDHANTAATYRDLALSYRTQAQQEAESAETARLGAETAKNNAATHAQAAANSASTSLSHAQTAEYWASQAETIVTGGDVVPSTRTINGKSLATNFSLNFSDVGAKPASYVPTWNEITGRPNFSAVAFTGSFADLDDAPLLADVATSGNFADLTNKPTAATLGAVPTSRTVNGKSLTSNITLAHTDVGAKSENYVPTWAEIVGKPASATRFPRWNEVTDKPTQFTPTTHGHNIGQINGLQSALDDKLPVSLGLFSDRNDQNQTITRQGRVTEIGVWSTGNVSKTLDNSFVENDVVIIKKYLEAGTLILTTQTGVIHIPNGTNAATQDLGDGISGTVHLTKYGNDWFIVRG